MKYIAENFILEYDKEKESVTTYYPDGKYSPTFVNPDDHYHGNLLGITALEHRLLHELAHHLVAMAKGLSTCPIIWASSHHEPMPEGADLMEWEITAISYLALSTEMRHFHEWNAIGKLMEDGIKIYNLEANIRNYFIIDYPDDIPFKYINFYL